LPADGQPLPQVQGQAVRWVKNMEASKKLLVMTLSQADWMRQIEGAVMWVPAAAAGAMCGCMPGPGWGLAT
jgi:hypothetical protein